jgi:ketosteroid isomerase-like protein
MKRRLLLTLATAIAAAGCTTLPPREAGAAAQPDRLRAAETAFAATMAARDLAAFATFIADDAVFINGGKPLRGKAAIVEHWRRFYSGPRAPFSWKPEIVEVLGSGRLGYSEGPVADPDGVVVARYASTWRLDAAGEWKVVFDNGSEVCRCAKAP